jgi:hypothetical protein
MFGMMETTDMRSLSREARHERRVQVIRLRKAGLTYEQIAEQTGLSRTGCLTSAAVTRRRRCGAEGRGRRAQDRREAPADGAAGERDAQVHQDKTPDQMKLPYALWTRRRWRS